MSPTFPQIKTNIPLDAQTIRECQKYVRSVQRNLDRAVAEGNRYKIRRLTYLLTKRSRAVKILAIHRVTVENEGKHTAGTDGMRVEKGTSQEVKEKNKALRTWLYKNADVRRKPMPIRREYIKKPNGKLRPLGIPTLIDRVIQDIVRTAIEPITEYFASENSYGFRPKRSCHDAVEHLFRKLAKRGARQWIIEGDISGCFDNIKQEQIQANLEGFNVPFFIRTIIKRMPKAKIFEQGTYIENETGTPQGGILSPMLANVALTTLDEYCSRYGSRDQKNPIVRYADDFVIVCKTREEAERVKKEIAEMLKEKIGLTLSEEKTKITNIEEGFNFLGFNVRKYKHQSPKSKDHEVGKLLIKPQNEKVQSHLKQLKQLLSDNKQTKQESVIVMLNQIRQGWAMYYRFAVSKDTFTKTEHKLWEKLWRWAKRRHPNKPKGWIIQKYFSTENGNKWRFRTKDKDMELIDITKIPIVRYTKVRSRMRVHDGSKEAIEYWRKREYANALDSIYSIKISKLFKRQNGKCAYCDQPITQDQIRTQDVHVHHLNPRTYGGDEKLNNLRLAHKQCHTEAHSIMPRKNMSYWAKHEANYFHRKYIRTFASLAMTNGKKKAETVVKVVDLRRKRQRIEERRRKTKKRLEEYRIASAKMAAQMLKEGRI